MFGHISTDLEHLHYKSCEFPVSIERERERERESAREEKALPGC